MASSPSTNTSKKTKKKIKTLPQYKVLLHNDNEVAFETAITAVSTIMHFPADKAEIHVKEAHENGLSLVCITHKERAELYIEQFMTYRLKATMEPA